MDRIGSFIGHIISTQHSRLENRRKRLAEKQPTNRDLDRFYQFCTAFHHTKAPTPLDVDAFRVSESDRTQVADDIQREAGHALEDEIEAGDPQDLPPPPPKRKRTLLLFPHLQDIATQNTPTLTISVREDAAHLVLVILLLHMETATMAVNQTKHHNPLRRILAEPALLHTRLLIIATEGATEKISALSFRFLAFCSV